MPNTLVKNLIGLLPVEIVPRQDHETFLPLAKEIIKDPLDVEILALALATKHPLWSNDKHFEKINEIHLIKTKDFV